ncbi:MAG: 16S rRNA (uracil(1498)-N(3))-methyltransferase [Verrucomicrobia bacterium]|nr:16S rRNA (uracil(1498)-N(3))-methyltransferase [Verrucomicrobiota bacterium]
MNLILFEPHEIDAPLPRRDRRAAHILDVLRRRVGDTFDAGLVNGPRGKATLAALDAHALSLTFAWGAPPSPPDPITLLIGLPRPQTARDILRDATTLGVAALHFVTTEKSEPNYARSTLWSSGEWRRHLILGAEQAFDPRLPEVSHGRPLGECIAALPSAAARLALDNYESPQPVAVCHLMDDKPVVLAIGPERGWSAAERALLRASGFAFCHLGPRVLRTETAVVAALALVRAKLGLLGPLNMFGISTP